MYINFKVLKCHLFQLHPQPQFRAESLFTINEESSSWEAPVVDEYFHWVDRKEVLEAPSLCLYIV